MKLIIAGKENAEGYEPKEPTAVMRIHHSNPRYQLKALSNENRYLAVFNYSYNFAPVTINEHNKPMDDATANQLLNDFESVRSSIATLVVHCTGGVNRSPGVGIALNRIYNLNIEERAIIRVARYPDWHAVHTLWKAACTRDKGDLKPLFNTTGEYIEYQQQPPYNALIMLPNP